MRALLFILGIAAAVYMTPGEGGLFYGWLLPLVALLSLAYVFWLGGAVAILLGLLAFHYTDIASDSLLRAVLLPVAMGVCVIYLAWWAGPGGGFADTGGDLGSCDGGDGGGCGGGD